MVVLINVVDIMYSWENVIMSDRFGGGKTGEMEKMGNGLDLQ